MGIAQSPQQARNAGHNRRVINIYCDESCHLENDNHSVMVLGALRCPLEKSREIAVGVREIKRKHSIKPDFEIKWTKVSPGKMAFYLDLVDYFFDHHDLRFRALVVPDKSVLRHDDFRQDHDTWYYKMYFLLLDVLVKTQCSYRIYLDTKDTRSGTKVAKLHEVLANNRHDYSRQIVSRVQTIRSHEVEMLQLADLLIGAVSYANRGLHKSEAKLALVERVREKSGYRLTSNTPRQENKFNVFVWRASAAHV